MKTGIYIHIPFCIRKCQYCDFFSEENTNSSTISKYIDAIVRELEQYKALNRTISSIYFGGGTPSLISPKLLSHLLNYIQKEFTLTSDIEISMEGNPGTINKQRLHDYHKAGINRFSLGVQSLNDKQLKILTRIHTRKDALKSIEYIDSIFTNYNIDLMHSLPNQCTNEALQDLTEVIRLKPKHISWYQLTIEEDSIFGKNPPELPEEKTIEDNYIEGYKILENNNYIHYEVSAFAKDGYMCQHNLNYWKFGDYISAGAGSHSKITIDGKIIRQSRIENIHEYISKVTYDDSIITTRIVPKDEILFEYMLNRLRLFSIISFSEYEERTGQNIEQLLNKIKKFENESLLVINNEKEYFELTERGKIFINYILEDFL